MLIMCLYAVYSCDNKTQDREQRTETEYQMRCKNMNKDNCNGYNADPFIQDTDPFKQDDSNTHENNYSELKIASDQEDFVIMQSGRASLADKQIPIIGRLQVYVRSGSQYATWRQFPSSIYYEVLVAPGKISVTPDYTMSISEDNKTYQAYAKMPADQIVGTNFIKNIFADFSPLIVTPGIYKIRARYFNRESNWLEITIEP